MMQARKIIYYYDTKQELAIFAKSCEAVIDVCLRDEVKCVDNVMKLLEECKYCIWLKTLVA